MPKSLKKLIGVQSRRSLQGEARKKYFLSQRQPKFENWTEIVEFCGISCKSFYQIFHIRIFYTSSLRFGTSAAPRSALENHQKNLDKLVTRIIKQVKQKWQSIRKMPLIISHWALAAQMAVGISGARPFLRREERRNVREISWSTKA